MIAIFCSLDSLSRLHNYTVFNVCPGRRCFSLFMTAKVCDILFDILSMCGVQSNVS